MRWLLSNLTSLLLSLALAALVWVVAVQEKDPVVKQTISRVEIHLVNQPADAELVNAEALPRTAEVTVEGPRSIVSVLRPEDITVTVDLSQVEPGSQRRLPLEVRYAPTRLVQFISVDPTQIEVHLERITSRDLPVKLTVDGKPAPGFAPDPPVVTPPQVRLLGPEPAVSQVAAAVAHVSIAGARAPVEQVVPVTLHDERGDNFTQLTPSPRSVTVTIGIHQLEDFREVAIKVNWKGQPAAGYRISKITLDPPTVLVTGRPEVIASLGVIETEPVDISEASGTVFKRVSLKLPEGISLVDQTSFLTIEVEIQPIESSVRVTKRLEVQGVGNRLYLLAVSPETVDVLLSGPLTVLDNLKPEDVRVVLNLVGYGEGTFQVPPQVEILPQDVMMENVLPSLVQVTLSATPPTPTPTPAPTRRP